ncbi:DUF421 domain-containing protein [Sediminibacterium soli]|uniref:DUF421 domain-containing protein n=1 Tax=Sediminibacterium soli TaxID=2698829 RepID=UPI00137B3535|nr:YetF domain-containing protein [Sediminibacterium soli]NCI46436.1 DUF421 domain-containing protein [Sediminibacterium soli]
MRTIDLLFGAHDMELTVWQMVNRAVLVFFISLALIRLSGRRSFGMRLPLDNIIVILLGAILSRGVVGASPFIPTIAAATAVVALHRLMGYLQVKHPRISRWVQGRKILLFSDGAFLRNNMIRALTSEEDIHEALRQNALEEDLETIDKVYLERNGKISFVKKNPGTSKLS